MANVYGAVKCAHEGLMMTNFFCVVGIGLTLEILKN